MARPSSRKAVVARKATPRKTAAGAIGREIVTRLRRASEARRNEYEVVMGRIRRLRAEGSQSFDELWETVAEVVEGEPPLFTAGGHTNVDSFIKKELPGETRRSVTRNVLVARSFTPADEARHGIGFLEEVAQYAKTIAGADEVPRAIDLDRLRVPVRRQGKTEQKTAREVTHLELRSARRALARGQGNKPEPNPQEEAIQKALRKQSRLKGVTARVRKGAVRFSPVPLEHLTVLGKALATMKPITPTKRTKRTK
ncbi:MAG: hypothetical protein HY698_13025 [Deltaproteobacteria bacterium]|nr:hypothetical protein [Deltaproteobacteria bacterium]